MAGLVAPDRLHYIRFGIEPAPAGLPQRVHDATAPLRLGYTGQLAAHKGVNLLVEAFTGLRTTRPVELHIHGFGTPEAEATVRRLAGDHPQIHFHGRYANADRWQILAGLDVCVVPSIWYENAGTVALEALAAGVPVVVARTGGVYETVTDGVHGLHVEPGNVEALRAQLQRLVDDPALVVRLQQGVRENPVRSSEEEMDEVAQLYSRVLSRQQAGERAMTRRSGPVTVHAALGLGGMQP
jgi:glycosyltransferase involved in cell wall biosynthesis